MSHVHKKGLSLLRQGASAEEFSETIRLRQKGKHKLKAIATVKASDVRSIVADQDTEQRRKGERLFYILDTDLDGRPHHCDVIATLPAITDKLTHAAAWRLERKRLSALFTSGLQPAAEFRNGEIANLPINHQDQASSS